MYVLYVSGMWFVCVCVLNEWSNDDDDGDDDEHMIGMFRHEIRIYSGIFRVYWKQINKCVH